MGQPKTTRKSKVAPRLGRDDWLDAAFEAVVNHGFDGVRVLVLADTLGVTRGSFYWHFKDHAELVQALLQRWRDRELALNHSIQGQSHADPVKELEALLEAALAHAGEDLQNMRFELALRGLGRRDPAVADMLVAVDQMRMALFENKFKRITPDPKAATDLASLFYLAIVGSYQALSRPQTPSATKQYLQSIISHYLIQQQLKAP